MLLLLARFYIWLCRSKEIIPTVLEILKQYKKETNIIFKHILFLIEINLYYYSSIAPFYHIRAKERAKFATLLHTRTGQKYGLKAE